MGLWYRVPQLHDHSGMAESCARIPCLCYSRTTPRTCPCNHNFIVKHNFKIHSGKGIHVPGPCSQGLPSVSQVPFEKRHLGKETFLESPCPRRPAQRMCSVAQGSSQRMTRVFTPILCTTRINFQGGAEEGEWLVPGPCELWIRRQTVNSPGGQGPF